ncbi:pirin family protein [Nocardioides sp.]|uniref:pirin family protein n=1 Tax=Nocardioides sp. TaxID=35761 RepID=UPI003562BD7F
MSVEVITAREVPLGGLRAMLVRRTLPTRGRSLIGAWCFLDHYGPDEVAASGGMSVAPHPHIGLQTVSWLFSGEIEHRDSAGNHAMVRPGELNLMTAGRGISHSEVSTSGTTTLHGAQLWVALPDEARDGKPGFEHFAPPPVGGPGWTARVFLGSLLGQTSPVATFTPLLGAEILLEPGAALDVPIDPAFEHGILVDTGAVTVVETEGGVVETPSGVVETSSGVVEQRAPASVVETHELGYLPPGPTELNLIAGPDGARILLLGGPPFGEPIVMWWNFVGRTHEEVASAREAWQQQLEQGYHDGRFGIPVGNQMPPIPAPAMPQVRLKQRH